MRREKRLKKGRGRMGPASAGGPNRRLYELKWGERGGVLQGQMGAVGGSRISIREKKWTSARS